MVDMIAEVSERESRRWRQAYQVERAIARTRRLLESQAAQADPSLAEKWQARLERQQQNLTGLMRN